MDDSFQMPRAAARAPLAARHHELGLPAGTEMLDPMAPQYIADLISWTAIGARTTESQTHREMASGLSMPVGFKNGTEGNLNVAVNAIESARARTPFSASASTGSRQSCARPAIRTRTWCCAAGGRPTTTRPALRMRRILRKAGREPRLMVDCSHAQTSKDSQEARTGRGAEIASSRIVQGNRSIMGVMLESNMNGAISH